MPGSCSNPAVTYFESNLFFCFTFSMKCIFNGDKVHFEKESATRVWVKTELHLQESRRPNRLYFIPLAALNETFTCHITFFPHTGIQKNISCNRPMMIFLDMHTEKQHVTLMACSKGESKNTTREEKTLYPTRLCVHWSGKSLCDQKLPPHCSGDPRPTAAERL